MHLEEFIKIIYISPAGSDEYPGNMEKPKKTLHGAVSAICQINGQKECNIVVYLREGIYELETTLKICMENWHSISNNITFMSYPGEKAVISGGKRISGWEKTKIGYLGKVWIADHVDVEYTRQLYINGKLAKRPRTKEISSNAWSVLDAKNMEFYGQIETFDVWPKGMMPIYSGYRTYDKEFGKWRNPKDIEAVFDVGWTHSVCPVEEIIDDGVSSVIKMRMPCFRDCQIKPGMQIGIPNYFENVFELLNEPGEWYFDRNERTIYYIPLQNDNIHSTTAVVPKVETLVRIEGTMENNIRNIAFKNIQFEYSSWLGPGKYGHPEIQSNLVKDPSEDKLFHSCHIKTASAVELRYADNIVFEDCSFFKLGNNGLDIGEGCSNNIIARCEFGEIGGNGVQIGGFSVRDAHPVCTRQIVDNNIIENCHIHDIGVDCKGGTGIIAGYIRNTRIINNEIYNVGYIGISLGWGWGFWDEDSDNRYRNFAPDYYPRFNNPTVMRRNSIEYNHIHHVLQKLHDGGGIYTLSMQYDSVIRGNLIHDNGSEEIKYPVEGYWVHDSADNESYKHIIEQKGFPGGIYLDEGSGGFDVSGNIVYNVAIPCFYHDSGIVGAHEKVVVHDNWFNKNPEDESFPLKASFKAGIR